MSTFYLVAGHGQGDSGAVGNSYREDLLARQFNDKLAIYLKKCGASVEMFNKNQNLYMQTANGKGIYSLNLKGKIVIETHLNAFNGSAYGTEVLIKSGLKADSYDIAILNTLAKYFYNRGFKSRNDLLNMNVCAQKGINYRLIELCFIDNKNDINIFIKNMDTIAKLMAENLTGQKTGTIAPSKPTTKPTPTPTAPAKKTNQQIADEVITGKWGNGTDRANRLKKAGYDFNAIQTLVNQKLLGKPAPKPAPKKKTNEQIANEVIKGLWGNGATRKSKLAKAGYNYNDIQKIVNAKLR